MRVSTVSAHLTPAISEESAPATDSRGAVECSSNARSNASTGSVCGSSNYSTTLLEVMILKTESTSSTSSPAVVVEVAAVVVVVVASSCSSGSRTQSWSRLCHYFRCLGHRRRGSNQSTTCQGRSRNKHAPKPSRHGSARYD